MRCTRSVARRAAANPAEAEYGLLNNRRILWQFVGSGGARAAPRDIPPGAGLRRSLASIRPPHEPALQPSTPTAHVPVAALRDPMLYKYLALVDAIRDGRARERKLAEQELSKLLHRDGHG